MDSSDRNYPSGTYIEAPSSFRVTHPVVGEHVHRVGQRAAGGLGVLLQRHFVATGVVDGLVGRRLHVRGVGHVHARRRGLQVAVLAQVAHLVLVDTAGIVASL